MSDNSQKNPDEVSASLFANLRRIATFHLRNERPDHTLQPSALVNEAWIVLQRQDNLSDQQRGEYLAAAAQIIRRILIDHARKRNRAKRGGGADRVSLNSAVLGVRDNEIDPLVMDDAMQSLAEQSSRAAEVVVLKFYGGMTNEEIANELSISTRTVVGDWTFARAWILRALADE